MLNILLSVTATVLFVQLCVIYPLGFLDFRKNPRKSKERVWIVFCGKYIKKWEYG